MQDTTKDGRKQQPLAQSIREVSERRKALALRSELPTDVPRLGEPVIVNPQPASRVGSWRLPTSRRAVLADMDFIMSFVEAGLPIPSLLEAGPRQHLFFDPATVRVAIVLLVFSVIDVWFQRYQYKKDLMMTKDEVKREYKESEGDPHHRLRINKLRPNVPKEPRPRNESRNDAYYESPISSLHWRH